MNWKMHDSRPTTRRRFSARKAKAAHDLMRRLAFRPKIESLEDRLAPALILGTPTPASPQVFGIAVSFPGSNATGGVSETIQLKENSVVYASTHPTAGGAFTLTTTSLPAGTHALLRAVSTGGTDPASGAVSYTITPDAVVVGPINFNDLQPGQPLPPVGEPYTNDPVNFGLNVANGSGGTGASPTGSVVFTVDGHQAGPAIPLVPNIPTVSTALMPATDNFAFSAGVHTVQAVYHANNGNFQATASNTLSLTVNKGVAASYGLKFGGGQGMTASEPSYSIVSLTHLAPVVHPVVLLDNPSGTTAFVDAQGSALKPGLIVTISGATPSAYNGNVVVTSGGTTASVTSLTTPAIGSTVASATTSAANPFITGDVVSISGAIPAEYDGNFVITRVDGTHFTFTLNSPSTATTATGTISAKDFGDFTYNLLASGLPAATGTIKASLTIAVAVTSSPNGYSTGDAVTIKGAASNNYNGTFAAIGVNNPTTFAFTIPGNPTTPDTGAPTVSRIIDTANPPFIAAPHTAVYGEPITFNAQFFRFPVTIQPIFPGVTSLPAGPTGTVTFLDGTTPIGTANLALGLNLNTITLTTNSATFSTAKLAVGSHTITASYGGDSNFLSSAIDGQIAALKFPVTIVTADVATSVVANPTNGGAGPTVETGTVTFTATVNGAGFSNGKQTGVLAPTGTVDFIDVSGATTTTFAAAVALTTHGASKTASANSTATATETITLGSVHTITANYTTATDPNYNAGLVANETGKVVQGQELTRTAVSENLNTTVVGETLTVTATVSLKFSPPDAGPASGTVNFIAVQGTATATLATSVALTGTTTTTGGQTAATATMTTNTLAPGLSVIKARYNGDSTATTSGLSNFAASGFSLGIGEQRNQDFSKVVPTFTPVSPSQFGQPVTMTATVSNLGDNVTSFGPTPTGTVTFTDTITTGGITTTTTLGTVTLTSTGAFTAAATLVKSNFSTGGHSLGFIYSGDVSVLASSRTGVGYAVGADATTSSLTVFPATGSVFGQQVTFSDKVTSQFGATPHGTVKFFSGTTLLFTTSLNIHGQAFFITSSLPVGTTGNISAVFAPPAGASFTGSTALLGGATVAQVVNPGGMTSGLLTRTAGSVVSDGAQKTLAAGALTSSGTTATLVLPAADTFYAAGDMIAVRGATQPEYNGVFAIATINPAHTSLTYTFAGSLTTPATGTITVQDLTVAAGFTVPNPFTSGEVVNIAGATPAGYNVSGVAVRPDPFAPIGGVLYDLTEAQMTAAGLTSPATGTITVQSTTRSEVVVNTTAPHGFSSGDSIAIAGATPAAYDGTFTINVTAPSQFKYIITGTATSPATGTITAQKGNASYTVAKANTTVGPPTSSNTHAIHGTAVTLTASVSAVSPGKGTPTGSIEFHDHGYTFTPTTGSSVTSITTGTVLGTTTLSGGVATLVLPTGLPAGVHQISADYLGDGNFNTSGPDATGGNTVLLGFHQLVEQVAVDNSTLLTARGTPSPSVGATVTFLAAVAPASNPTGTGAIGFLTVLADVVFKEGTTTLGTGHCGFIPGRNEGLATLTTSSLAIGLHTITATYKGNDLFGELPTPATTTFVETVTPPVALNAALALTQPSGSTSFAATTRRHGTAPSQSLGAASLDQYFASTPSTTHSTRTLAGALARAHSNDDLLNGG
jgi:hypothetical protein